MNVVSRINVKICSKAFYVFVNELFWYLYNFFKLAESKLKQHDPISDTQSSSLAAYMPENSKIFNGFRFNEKSSGLAEFVCLAWGVFTFDGI